MEYYLLLLIELFVASLLQELTPPPLSALLVAGLGGEEGAVSEEGCGKRGVVPSVVKRTGEYCVVQPLFIVLHSSPANTYRPPTQGSNSPMSPKRGDNEKSRKEIEAKKRDMGRKVMDLARKRHKLMAFAIRFNCACILISTILGVVAVGMDRQTLEGRKNQQVCVALIMAVACTHICLPCYALATLGKTQVQLYNKRNVTHLYWSTVLVYILALIAATISIIDQVALAVDENGGAGKTSVPNNIFLLLAGSSLPLGTFQLNKLLSIPVKAARRQGKVKGAPDGGNQSTTTSSDNDDHAASPDYKRRGSTMLIRGGLMDTQAFNNSKVVPESGRGG